MSTMDKTFADRLIAGGGWLAECPDHGAPDNPRCIRIVQYTNHWGWDVYGCTFAGENPMKYLIPTDYIRNPIIYWEAPK